MTMMMVEGKLAAEIRNAYGKESYGTKHTHTKM